MSNLRPERRHFRQTQYLSTKAQTARHEDQHLDREVFPSSFASKVDGRNHLADLT